MLFNNDLQLLLYEGKIQMKSTKDNYELELLYQLKDIVPRSAYGPNSTMFAIALEGWRRGLQLKFYTKLIKNRVKIRYALASEEKEIPFQLSLAEIVPKKARRITRSKADTKEVLIRNKVSTPQGGSFNEKDTDTDIMEYAQNLGYPLIIKPTNASLGIGVITDIQNKDMLEEALKELRGRMGYKEIILEQEVTGDDTRLFVIGDEVFCAFKRIAPNVTGNGKNTIKELISDKNDERKNHPHMNGSRIPINDDVIEHLAKQNLTLDSILEEGKNITLDTHTFPSNGAEIAEVTEELTEEDRKLAVQAAKTLPGLTVCGVDIMIDREKDTRYVLELNSRPNIIGSLFPWVGTPKNIAKAIVDFYFPESLEETKRREGDNFYFDFDEISRILKSGIAKEIIVPPLTKKEIIMKKLIVTGKVQGVGFRKWVQRTATGFALNGFVKNLKNGNVQIVIAGTSQNVNKFIENVETKKSKKIRVEKVRVTKWDNPVKAAFEIKTSTGNIDKLKKELSKVKNRNNELETKLKKTQQKLSWMEKSKSWRLTLPARKLLKTMKRN